MTSGLFRVTLSRGSAQQVKGTKRRACSGIMEVSDAVSFYFWFLDEENISPINPLHLAFSVLRLA